MKIIHVIFSFETGGAEALLIDLLNEQCQLAEVFLIVVNNLISKQQLNLVNRRVKTFLVNRRPGSLSVSPIARLNWLIQQIRPQVVHCHDPELTMMLVNRMYTTCLTIHDVNQPIDFLSQYDKLFAISRAVVNEVRETSGHGTTLVRNGIHCDQVRSRSDWQPEATFRMVQISRLQHEKKGQHILLRALHELVHVRGHHHLRLDFIGPGESEAYLKDLTRELNLEEYVRFLGVQDRAFIYEHLCEYHLLIQPSLYEGFGLTVAEGMAAGLPVLVSAIEGPLEVIDDGHYGWSFPAGEANACADAIGVILADYGSEAFQQKVAEARRWVSQSFDVRHTARNYLQHYQLHES